LNTNQEALELQEIIGCEPVEYVDKYIPSKYGIIFKEKVLISPAEHTLVSLNVKLNKNEQSLRELGLSKFFVFQILDNGKLIFEKKGYNQINVSHLMFRCN